MADAPPLALEQRREQMFPQLTPAQVDVAKRFGGTPRRFGPNELIVHFGQVGSPAWLVLAGHIAVARQDPLGNRQEITQHLPGMMAGELTQLAGGPAGGGARAAPGGGGAGPGGPARGRAGGGGGAGGGGRRM